MSLSNKGLENYEIKVESSSKKTIKEAQTLLDMEIRNESQVVNGCGNCSGCKC